MAKRGPKPIYDEKMTARERAALHRQKMRDAGYVDLRMFVPAHLREHLRVVVEDEIKKCEESGDI